MITATFSGESNPRGTSMQDAISTEEGEKVGKECFKLILLDGCTRFRTARQLNEEGEHEWAERLLSVIEVICQGGQAIEQAKAIRLSRMTNRFTVIMHTDHSFLSVIKTGLNYVGRLSCNRASQLQRNL